MTALRFESESAFAVALGARMIPEEIAKQPVRFSRVPRKSDDPTRGHEIVVDATELDDAAIDRLVGAGAARARLPKSTLVAPFWPSIVTPVRTERIDPSVVLFLVSKGAPLSGLGLAAQLLSLGARRIEITTAVREGAVVALVRAAEPSWYMLSRALDREEGLRAFVPGSSDRDAIWIELGFAHPGLAALRPENGELLLVDREGTVEHLRPAAFVDVNDAIELTLAPRAAQSEPVALPKHTVPLTLGRATRPRQPSLWVIREDAIRHLDRLVREAPEALLHAVSFVALGDPRAPTVVLRASGGGPPPMLFEGDAYAALPELGDVFVPVDKRVHPPVGPHRLRAVVGGPDDRVRWLVEEKGSVRVETVAHAAFAPLIDWVELAASHADLEPWVANVTFDPLAFEAHARNPSGKDREKEERAPDSTPARRRRTRAISEPEEARAPAPDERETRAPTAKAAPTRPAAETGPAPDERLLEQAEQRLGENDLPLASPERDDAWLELARLYAGRSEADARLCWARVIMSAPELGGQAATAWLEASLARAKTSRERAWTAATAQKDATQGAVELCAALSVATSYGGPLPDATERARAATLLEAADAALDVRSAWLAREAIARLSGGDTLLLARARDRALGRLEQGLSLGRDFPRAVRRLDASASADRSRVLGEIQQFFESTRRKKSALEADPAQTTGYVKLVFGCAFARSGDATRARACIAESAPLIQTRDAVTDVMIRSFAARIESALEGAADGTPLPREIVGLYEALGRLDRYKVDRMRSGSKLLEPDPDLDPFRAFGASNDTSLTALRGRVVNATQPSDAARALDEAVAACRAEKDPPKRFERLAAILGAIAYAPPAVGDARLEEIPKLIAGLGAEDRIRASATAMAVAEQLESADVVRALADGLPADLAELPLRSLAGVVPHLVRVAPSLRRHGAGKVFETVLRNILEGLRGNDALIHGARLALGRGLVDLGAPDGVAQILEEELAFLEGAEVSPADRLQMVRSAASCAAGLDDLDAVRRLSRLWPRMTDNYNTNTHFCLSAVELADAIAWSLAPRRGDSSSLSRRLADEDEHAVRAAIFARLAPPSRRR